ncbi:MAG: CPBP family intramembrane metalloprotease [Bacilli bacterium]|nr:MAG: CPBP family intramembrane metalloprotease [Bacilli bacterium]
MFLLNIDVNSISDVKYLFYLSIFLIYYFLIIYFFIYKDTLIKDFKKYFSDFNKNFELSFKYWLVGFGIMVISNLILTYVLKMTTAGNEEVVRGYIDTAPLLMIFCTCIYAPVCEELTFRKSIRDVIDNKYLYVLVSGLIFGLLHVIGFISTPLDLLYLIPYGSLGIVFLLLLYYRTNNIFSSITIHAMHNALSVLVYLFIRRSCMKKIVRFFS